MREIKFRIWDGEEKKFLEHDNYVLYFDHLGEDVFELKRNRQLSDYKLLQYTGLKDKNGKEIYEGDVIRFIDDYINCTENGTDYEEFINRGEIYFNVDEACWDVSYRSIEREEVFNQIEEIEIIGNVFESPELLEGENNER